MARADLAQLCDFPSISKSFAAKVLVLGGEVADDTLTRAPLSPECREALKRAPTDTNSRRTAHDCICLHEQ